MIIVDEKKYVTSWFEGSWMLSHKRISTLFYISVNNSWILPRVLLKSDSSCLKQNPYLFSYFIWLDWVLFSLTFSMWTFELEFLFFSRISQVSFEFVKFRISFNFFKILYIIIKVESTLHYIQIKIIGNSSKINKNVFSFIAYLIFYFRLFDY